MNLLNKSYSILLPVGYETLEMATEELLWWVATKLREMRSRQNSEKNVFQKTSKTLRVQTDRSSLC